MVKTQRVGVWPWHAYFNDCYLSHPIPWILTGTVVALVAWFLWRSFNNRTYPPCPPGWPLIGNALDIGQGSFGEDLVNIQSKYRLPDIFSLKFGPMNRTVILNTYDVIKDAMVTQGELFAGRPPSVIPESTGFKDEIFFKDYLDPTWTSGKNFIMSALRSVGFGTTRSAEDKILEQVERLTVYLEKNVTDAVPTHIGALLPRANANVIFEILFSKIYDLSNPELQKMVELSKDFNDAIADAFYLDFFGIPWALSKWFIPSKLTNTLNDIRAFIKQEINEHAKTIDPNEPRDFIDIYLSKKDAPIDSDTLTATTSAFLDDAIDTVSVFINWTILYVTHNGDVMRRIQKEIDTVTGANRHVKWSDHPNLPYVQAVIMESVRVACPVDSTGSHTPIRDCQFRGYFIPKGTIVLANLRAVMMDPEVFPDPKTFNPNRFLDEGNSLRKDNVSHWIPFGMGRRKCAGEQIAKIQVFLFVANLLKRYNFSFPAGEPLPTLDSDLKNIGLVKRPQPYKVVIAPRQ